MAAKETVAEKPATGNERTSQRPGRAQPISAGEARAIVQEAYVFLYPLIIMDITRRQMINGDPKLNPAAGPANAFAHIRSFPPADLKVVVRPNFDTLYSTAWLDLTAGPVVLATADTGGRYFLLPILDLWTDVFAVPGKRTNGTGAASFAIVPPGWSGKLPGGVERIDAPTPVAWIIGRTQTNGARDYHAVRQVQDGYKLTPLADWGKAPRRPEQKIDPGIDTKTPPLLLVNKMAAADFFTYGAELMKVNPPHVTDWSIVARMKRIGIEPGKSFAAGTVSVDDLARGAAAGLAHMSEKAPTLAAVRNGWQMNTDTMGVYGNFYLKRAIVAMTALGANPPEDAIYPIALSDAEGQALRGEHAYVLHFARDELPPVDAFWSLTLYDGDGFPTANPLDRHALGDRDALAYNADGSLDLYIQHDTPGAEREANWLPAPASGVLSPTLRLYAPRPPVADGRWTPPPLRRRA